MIAIEPYYNLMLLQLAFQSAVLLFSVKFNLIYRTSPEMLFPVCDWLEEINEIVDIPWNKNCILARYSQRVNHV